MPESAHSASARRDDRLIRIRRLSLWITGVAVAASLGLGTAFAQALPGHTKPGPAAASAPSAAGPLSSPGTRARGATANLSCAAGAAIAIITAGWRHRSNSRRAP